MGLRDRIAKAIATGNIEKAPRLPAGSVTMTESEMRNQADALTMRQTYGNSIALPRAPFSAAVPLVQDYRLLQGQSILCKTMGDHNHAAMNIK